MNDLQRHPLACASCWYLPTLYLLLVVCGIVPFDEPSWQLLSASHGNRIRVACSNAFSQTRVWPQRSRGAVSTDCRCPSRLTCGRWRGRAREAWDTARPCLGISFTRWSVRHAGKRPFSCDAGLRSEDRSAAGTRCCRVVIIGLSNNYPGGWS